MTPTASTRREECAKEGSGACGRSCSLPPSLTPHPRSDPGCRPTARLEIIEPFTDGTSPTREDCAGRVKSALDTPCFIALYLSVLRGRGARAIALLACQWDLIIRHLSCLRRAGCCSRGSSHTGVVHGAFEYAGTL